VVALEKKEKKGKEKWKKKKRKNFGYFYDDYQGALEESR
jgi:hypothetical protein